MRNKYFDETTLSSSAITFLPSFNGVSDGASKMIIDSSDDDAGNKTKFQPLSMIQMPALHIVNSPTNIYVVVREAFKFLLLLDSYSSSSADEESSGQDQEQEGGDEDDDLEGDN
jgi:hypothetical protein